jgi:hypothetical protein
MLQNRDSIDLRLRVPAPPCGEKALQPMIDTYTALSETERPPHGPTERL